MTDENLKQTMGKEWQKVRNAQNNPDFINKKTEITKKMHK